MKNRYFWIGVFSGVVAIFLIAGLVVPALGLVPMSVTDNPGILDWWGNLNWKSSLHWRAPDAKVPPAADAAHGLEHYAAMCVVCHGSPGAPPAEWAHAMQPMPPKLWEQDTQQMTDGQLFHIVRGGVRMTGMPAFGKDHRDEDIWNLVAFVRQLNSLTPARQQKLNTAADSQRHEQGGANQHEDHSALSP